MTQRRTCRDSGCGGRAKAAGLTEDDCCIGCIMDSDVFCSDSETAPCIIDIGEHFGLVLRSARGWNMARDILDFITLLFVTRGDQSWRSRRRAIAVCPSSEKSICVDF